MNSTKRGLGETDSANLQGASSGAEILEAPDREIDVTTGLNLSTMTTTDQRLPLVGCHAFLTSDGYGPAASEAVPCRPITHWNMSSVGLRTLGILGVRALRAPPANVLSVPETTRLQYPSQRLSIHPRN